MNALPLFQILFYPKCRIKKTKNQLQGIISVIQVSSKLALLYKNKKKQM
jgi:hypothetical protein